MNELMSALPDSIGQAIAQNGAVKPYLMSVSHEIDMRQTTVTTGQRVRKAFFENPEWLDLTVSQATEKINEPRATVGRIMKQLKGK